jgi:hypothetical protein
MLTWPNQKGIVEGGEKIDPNIFRGDLKRSFDGLFSIPLEHLRVSFKK